MALVSSKDHFLQPLWPIQKSRCGATPPPLWDGVEVTTNGVRLEMSGERYLQTSTCERHR